MPRSSVLERLITDALATDIAAINSSVGQPDGIASLDSLGQQPAAEQTPMLADTIKGRLATDGTPQELTALQVRQLLIDDTGSLATDVWSANKIAAEIAAALVGFLDFKGGYDAGNNVPDLVAGTGVLKGDAYTVTAAGDPFRGTTPLEVGDFLFANVDAPAAESDWTIVNKNIDLATVDAPGIVQLANDGDTTAGLAVQANDSRLVAGRTKLAANTTLYINATSGSDTTGAGLTTGAGAYQSIDFALQDAANIYDLLEYGLTFQLEDGTHTVPAVIHFPRFISTAKGVTNVIFLSGNSSNPNNTIINYTGTSGAAVFRVDQVPMRVQFANFKATIDNSTTTDLISAIGGSLVVLAGQIILSGIFSFAYSTQNSGRIVSTSVFKTSFETATVNGYLFAKQSQIDLRNATVEVLTGQTLTIALAFVVSNNQGILSLSGDAAKYINQGTVTGSKFLLTQSSYLDLASPSTTDTSILLGDSDGTIEAGSGYGYLGNYVDYEDSYGAGANNIVSAVDLAVRNLSINRENITADKTLTVTDVAYQHLILDADREAFLPATPPKNLFFAFINGSLSLGNLTVGDAVLLPGDRYEVIFDDVEWIEL